MNSFSQVSPIALYQFKGRDSSSIPENFVRSRFRCSSLRFPNPQEGEHVSNVSNLEEHSRELRTHIRRDLSSLISDHYIGSEALMH